MFLIQLDAKKYDWYDTMRYEFDFYKEKYSESSISYIGVMK